MATILQGITEMVPMAKFYLSLAAPFGGTIAVTYSGVFATVAVRRCRRLLSRHCSFHFPLVQFTSCRWSDFWRLYLRRQSCRRMLTQKGAKMWRSRRNGSGILHEAASRAGDSHRSFSFVSPNPRPHSEVGVCMDAKHSGLFRPAPQFIIRRCRCEGATPSSPLAVCMHKPAAEPINQSSIHPSPRRSPSLFLLSFPSPNSECCHYVLASPQSLFSVSSRRHSRQAGRSAGTDSPGSGRSRVSRISLAAWRGGRPRPS